MTGDVGADALEVRCVSCGTVVRLTDQPVAAAAPGAAPMAALSTPAPAQAPAHVLVPPNRVALALAVGLAGPLLIGLAFGTAHDALDEPEPFTGTAGTWFLVTVVLGAGAVFALWPAMGGQPLPHALWGLLAAVPMFFLTMVAGQAYDDDGFAWVILGLPLLGVYLLTVGITAAVVGNRGGGAGAAAVLVPGVGLCFALALGAIYFLLTLEQQATDARTAHEAPAWGLILTLGTLLALAARQRRLTP